MYAFPQHFRISDSVKFTWQMTLKVHDELTYDRNDTAGCYS